MRRNIENAKSIEGLNFIRWVIREDIESGCDWTKDKELIKDLRELWQQKQQELIKKNSSNT